MPRDVTCPSCRGSRVGGWYLDTPCEWCLGLGVVTLERAEAWRAMARVIRAECRGRPVWGDRSSEP